MYVMRGIDRDGYYYLRASVLTPPTRLFALAKVGKKKDFSEDPRMKQTKGLHFVKVRRADKEDKAIRDHNQLLKKSGNSIYVPYTKFPQR